MNWYKYIFYKFYKFSEAATSKWWSEWKALILLGVLCIFVLISVLFYLTLLTDIMFGLSKTSVVGIVLGIVVIPNYLVFMPNDNWRTIINNFDTLPKRRNKAGSFIVLLVVLFVVFNMVFSIYLTDRKARKEHTGPYSIEKVNLKHS